MPRVFLPEIYGGAEDVRVGLWQIAGSPSSLITACPVLESFRGELEKYKSAARRMEFLAVRALLWNMNGRVPEIMHNKDGKPFLADGCNISISHTHGYAAVILSEKHNVAVDIEYMNERVCRIAGRFLRPDEKADTVLEKLLAWCGKETLYKLHSGDKLAFHDMRVEGIVQGAEVPLSSGHFYVENLKRKIRVRMDYIATEMFVMTCAVEKND